MTIIYFLTLKLFIFYLILRFQYSIMMKAFKLLFFCLLFSSVSGFSQGNYRQNNYNGLNNRDYTGSSKPSAEEIEKYRTKQLEEVVKKLKIDLDLDELQAIAIKNEMTSNRKNVDIIIKKENSEEDKRVEIKALMAKSEITINSYLNNIQKEKYKALLEESKSGKKKKKNKKDEKPSEE